MEAEGMNMLNQDWHPAFKIKAWFFEKRCLADLLSLYLNLLSG